MLNYQRVLSTDFYQWLSLSLQHPYSILVTSDGWALDPNLHAIISLKQTKRHRKPQRHRFSHEIKNIRTAQYELNLCLHFQMVPFFCFAFFFGSEFCLDVDGVLIRGGSAQEANPPPIQGHSHWILSQDVSTICGYVPPKCLFWQGWLRGTFFWAKPCLHQASHVPSRLAGPLGPFFHTDPPGCDMITCESSHFLLPPPHHKTFTRHSRVKFGK